jgi:protein involved in polysaccharide export with SLBB domain
MTHPAASPLPCALPFDQLLHRVAGWLPAMAVLCGGLWLSAALAATEPGPASVTPTASTAPQPAALPVFGAQMFQGRFASQSFSGFNPDYQIAPGDRVSVRLWGTFTLESVQVVDAQGNIFLPSLGPVRVQGVRNGELGALIQGSVKRVYRSSVHSYATLEAAQPVKVYVTGFVRQPGLYGGLSSDAVLRYLDLAGGIDTERGSYLAVEVLRGGQLRARFDLYRFLLEGRIEPLQLQDGDTIFVPARQSSVRIDGEVANPAFFELRSERVPASELLAMARPRPGATHLSVVRQIGPERRSEYHPIGDAARVQVGNGDQVSVTADRIPGTILVRFEGAHRGERTAVLPYGARLSDALALLKPAPQAQVEALQLYRRSIAVRQKEMLLQSLDKLETQALTARSATNEEAALRTRESELILKFTAQARTVEPKGRLVLPSLASAGQTLLEDGDTLVVPEQSSHIAVQGEVLFPLTLQYAAPMRVVDYIRQAGGYGQQADTSRVLLMKRSGAVVETSEDHQPEPGDELMVLAKVETKRIEVARGITQVLYQIAVVAKVALGL